MNYKRYPSGRKYSYNTPKNAHVEDILLNTNGIIEKDIPLPNEIEDDTFQSDNTRKSPLNSFFDSLRGFIGLEELLIAGLVLLLIFDGIQDEFLILILLFILFT